MWNMVPDRIIDELRRDQATEERFGNTALQYQELDGSI
jgi:hypothetical protein